VKEQEAIQRVLSPHPRKEQALKILYFSDSSHQYILVICLDAHYVLT
jgi:hypothetical protein